MVGKLNRTFDLMPTTDLHGHYFLPKSRTDPKMHNAILFMICSKVITTSRNISRTFFLQLLKNVAMSFSE